MRRGNLLGLRWSDVDLDRRVVYVGHTAQRVYGHGMVFGPPKSLRSRRDIPLPAVTVGVLDEHRKRQEEERAAIEPYWQGTGLVFTTTVGTVIEPRDLARALDGLIIGCGGSGCTTCGTHARRCCWRKGCRREWRWRSWGTRSWTSR